MLDHTTRPGQIVEAAMRLAASRGWSGLTLDEIAAEAGCDLAAFRREFQGKAPILAAFTRAVDDAVLSRVGRPEPGIDARDRLFDVLMTRFEIMAPYKAALRHIARDLRQRPVEGLAQIGASGRSMYWMLTAAGLDAENAMGAVRIPGAMGIYAAVFDIWLEDDDAGMARTMAALDSRLRRAERMVRRVDDMLAAASRMLGAFKGRRPTSPPAEESAAPPPALMAPGNPPTGPAGTESGPSPAI